MSNVPEPSQSLIVLDLDLYVVLALQTVSITEREYTHQGLKLQTDPRETTLRCL